MNKKVNICIDDSNKKNRTESLDVLEEDFTDPDILFKPILPQPDVEEPYMTVGPLPPPPQPDVAEPYMKNKLNIKPPKQKNKISQKYISMNFSGNTANDTSSSSLGEVAITMAATTIIMFVIVLVGSCILLTTFYMFMNSTLKKDDSRREIAIGLQWFYLVLGVIGAGLLTMKYWSGNLVSDLIGLLILLVIPVALSLPSILILGTDVEDFSAFLRAYLGLSTTFGLVMGGTFIAKALEA